jgi:hypothetical protein
MRGELLSLIEKAETVPSLHNSPDKIKYLGTILWRYHDRFVNLPGYGYWIKSQPFADAHYVPEAVNMPDAALSNDDSEYKEAGTD